MCAVALKRSTRSRRRFALPGAKPAPAPCDPTLRERAPKGSDWLHEIKIDGDRAQLHIHDGRVRVFSRSGYDWTEQFSQIARAAEALSVRELIIDGEATVVGKTGLPDFEALRREVIFMSAIPASESVCRLNILLPTGKFHTQPCPTSDFRTPRTLASSHASNARISRPIR
jgi:ATP-dependent DNA ligase